MRINLFFWVLSLLVVVIAGCSKEEAGGTESRNVSVRGEISAQEDDEATEDHPAGRPLEELGDDWLYPWWVPGWEALCDKWDNQGYDALSEPEKVWVNVRMLIDSTNNGGLLSYFYNSGADTLPDCLAALDTLSAAPVRRQVERLAALFKGGVPATMDERNEVIDTWGDWTEYVFVDVDERLFALFDELELKLEEYVRNHGLAAPSIQKPHNADSPLDIEAC